MISLAFQIPETFIAYYALTGTDKSFFRKNEFDSDVLSLQRAAAGLDKASIELIQEDYLGLFYLEPELSNHQLSSSFKKIDDMLELLKGDSTLKKLLRESSDSLTVIRHEWEESLAKMHDLSDFLLDGKEKAEVKVFISLPSMNLSHEYFGDIFIGLDDRTAYANVLNLWTLINSLFVKPGDADASIPYAEANQRWLRDLLLDLCNCEVKSRLSLKNSFEPSQANDKPYRRDFEFLMPKFKDYLKSNKAKRLSEFRSQAMNDLQKLWNSSKKSG